MKRLQLILLAKWIPLIRGIRRLRVRLTRRGRSPIIPAKLKRLKLTLVAKLTRLKMRISRVRPKPPKQVWVPAITAITVIVAVALSVAYWNWLRGYVNGVPPEELESPSTTVRNLALGVAGFLALVVALWRGWVANRQAETAQQQLLSDRYQKATEMLGSSVMTVRLGGIHELQRLANENTAQFHVPVLQSLCGFIQEPTIPVENPSNASKGAFSHIPADIRAALEAIQDRGLNGRREIEIKEGYSPDLRGARLPGANLIGMDLSRTQLDEADLSGAALNGCFLAESSMWNAELSDAELEDAILINADLFLANLAGADFTEADLAGANLSDASFSDEGQNPARGLTQPQFDTAIADRGSEPNLMGVLDADTGEPLVWNGITLTNRFRLHSQ